MQAYYELFFHQTFQEKEKKTSKTLQTSLLMLEINKFSSIAITTSSSIKLYINLEFMVMATNNALVKWNLERWVLVACKWP
jgi:hypothetical protein